MKKWNQFSQLAVIMSVIFLITACKQTFSPSEAIEKSTESMEAIDSVEVSINDRATESTLQADKKNSQGSQQYAHSGVQVTYDADRLLVQDAEGSVFKGAEEDYVELQESITFLINPFQILKEFDPEISEKLIIKEEKGNELTLVYDSDTFEEEIDELSKKIFLFTENLVDEITDESVEQLTMIEYDTIDLEITIDKNDYLLNNFKVYTETTEGLTGIGLEASYGQYNQAFDIVMLEESPIAKESTTLVELDQKEAVEYLEALIQATIFQDAEKFVELAPESMGQEEKEREAEIQRDAFKNIYIENTKENMAGFNISEEKIISLADAFLDALGRTTYEIVDQETVEEGVIVTLSIHGFNTTAVDSKINEELTKLNETENLTQEELVDKNIDLMIDYYQEGTIMEDASLVEITVQESEETYIVLQDEFLLHGFVH